MADYEYQRPPEEGDYTYQPLEEKDSIRLLRVHPAKTFDAPLVCDLRTTKLSDKQDYAALSYTWGPLVFDRQMLLNGRPFYTTSNLSHALHLFRATGWQMIWVDAICINQADLVEKSRQILLLRPIFSQALCVFVCLGISGPDGHSAMQLM